MYVHNQIEWEFRLLSRLMPVGDCLEWQGCLDNNGYGVVRKNKKQLSPHRSVYEIVKGKIPKGKVLDHLCRNRKCANPNHLEAVTQRTNILRGVGMGAFYAARTHCKHGHELTKQNSYAEPGKTYRRCRKCITRRTSEWRKRV